jgi:hypothetical protein
VVKGTCIAIDLVLEEMAQNLGEKNRFPEKWEIAICTPMSMLARFESFLPDIAVTVL